MTESTGHGPEDALFARIQQRVDERGVDIRQHRSGHALRLEFADGQRIVINFDPNTQNIWLATRSGGTEFIHRDGNWHTHEQGELFARLSQLLDQTIASNPVNARPPVAQPVAARPAPVIIHHEAPQSHSLRNVLIVLLAGLLGFWAAQKLNPPQGTNGADADNIALNQLDPGQSCEAALPANGSITVFPDSGLRADGPNDPEFTLKNDHRYPLLLILSRPSTVIPAMSVLVHAHQTATLHLPAGRYDLLFSVGTAWCNARRGFSDGHMLKFDKSLTVEMDKPVQLAMQSSGTGMEEFQLFVKTAAPEESLPPPTFSGDGSMEVQRQANGHFYLPGTIENIPVTFMVDTGASVTSINSDLARQAGIRNCKEMQFETANGTATGCIALVPRMTLGNFVLENITVAVMPNMDTNLLGANVLRNFQVSQNGSSMLIGRR